MKIGQLTLKGKHYEGTVKTLILNFPFTLEPNENRKEKAPDFHVMDELGNERGYAYRESFDSESEGRTVSYFSIKIDDPALMYPIYCKAYMSDKEQIPLTWSRPKKKAA